MQSRHLIFALVACVGSSAYAMEPPATTPPPNPNLSPEFPVPSTLPEPRPAPRPYDCTMARGLGDCTQTPGPPPAVQGAPLPPPRLPNAAGEPPTTPGVPKLPGR